MDWETYEITFIWADGSTRVEVLAMPDAEGVRYWAMGYIRTSGAQTFAYRKAAVRAMAEGPVLS